MPTTEDEEHQASSESTEQSPLLPDRDQLVGDGTILWQGEGNDDDDNIPLVEEPSTGQAVITLASIWVGVFLAALGM
jgi:hypothetical protein